MFWLKNIFISNYSVIVFKNKKWFSLRLFIFYMVERKRWCIRSPHRTITLEFDPLVQNASWFDTACTALSNRLYSSCDIWWYHLRASFRLSTALSGCCWLSILNGEQFYLTRKNFRPCQKKVWEKNKINWVTLCRKSWWPTWWSGLAFQQLSR